MVMGLEKMWAAEEHPQLKCGTRKWRMCLDHDESCCLDVACKCVWVEGGKKN
jgi:hypothetical protein